MNRYVVIVERSGVIGCAVLVEAANSQDAVSQLEKDGTFRRLTSVGFSCLRQAYPVKTPEEALAEFAPPLSE